MNNTGNHVPWVISAFNMRLSQKAASHISLMPSQSVLIVYSRTTWNNSYRSQMMRSWILQWRPRCYRRRHGVIRELRFDDGNVNDNATNQWFHWLNEEKWSCCSCGTLFGAMFWRSLPNGRREIFIFEVLTTTGARSSKSFILCL